jgi:hypothetical protein
MRASCASPWTSSVRRPPDLPCLPHAPPQTTLPGASSGSSSGSSTSSSRSWASSPSSWRTFRRRSLSSSPSVSPSLALPQVHIQQSRQDFQREKVEQVSVPPSSAPCSPPPQIIQNVPDEEEGLAVNPTAERIQVPPLSCPPPPRLILPRSTRPTTTSLRVPDSTWRS